jgi:hypothetical protein
MYDSTGQEVTEVGPGTPVTVTGWREVPVAGDVMLEAVKGEEEAKKAIDNRLRDQERKALVREGEIINAKREEERLRAATEALDIAQAKEAGKNVAQLLAQQRRAADAVKAAGKKELRLLIKGDVSGTVEAVVGSLAPIGNAEAGVKVIHTGVGDVTESDIMHAEASEATVIGFNVECPRSIMTLANMSEVPVHVDSVIYRLIDTVRGQVSALLPPAIEYRITGEATVQQIFEIKKGKDVHVIAGCKVNNGVISRAEPVRVLRGPNRAVVHEGRFISGRLLRMSHMLTAMQVLWRRSSTLRRTSRRCARVPSVALPSPTSRTSRLATRLSPLTRSRSRVLCKRVTGGREEGRGGEEREDFLVVSLHCPLNHHTHICTHHCSLACLCCDSRLAAVKGTYLPLDKYSEDDGWCLVNLRIFDQQGPTSLARSP